jgi:uncharacterized protein YjbJ (UPF0337 family)
MKNEGLCFGKGKSPEKWSRDPPRPRFIFVMTTLTLKGNWNELKGKLKQKYGELTDDDLTFADGKEDELYGRLQKRLGKTKDDVRKIIDDL